MMYRLFLMFDWVMMHLPRGVRRGFFFGLGSLLYPLARRRNRVITQNLTFAFGEELSIDDHTTIAKGCYHNLILNLLQVMENRRNDAQTLAHHVTFHQRAEVDALLAKERAIIFVSGHLGNWEIGGAALSALITPIHAIYKGFKNTAFDPYLRQARTHHRMVLAEKNGALKHMAKALRDHQSILIMMDQASDPKYGVSTTFFGHATYHSSTAAQLAYKFQAPIISVYITTENERDYDIHFSEAIYLTDATQITDATQRQVDLLETTIRTHPSSWFWCHKRWKREYPQIYTIE